MHCLVCFAMVCDYIKIFSSKFIFHQFESIRYEQCKQILPNNLSIKSFSHVVEQINLPLNLRCMAYVSLCTWSCVVDLIINRLYYENIIRGRRGHDRMVVGFKNYLCNQCLSPLMLWVSGFLWVFRFPPPINWPPRYNWNIVESHLNTIK
jgi:hypothetical protein